MVPMSTSANWASPCPVRLLECDPHCLLWCCLGAASSCAASHLLSYLPSRCVDLTTKHVCWLPSEEIRERERTPPPHLSHTTIVPGSRRFNFTTSVFLLPFSSPPPSPPLQTHFRLCRTPSYLSGHHISHSLHQLLTQKQPAPLPWESKDACCDGI